jgi:TonB family protein
LKKYSSIFSSISNFICGFGIMIFLSSIPVFSVTVELPKSISNNLIKNKFQTISVSKDSIFLNEKPIGSTLIISKIPQNDHDPIVQELVTSLKSLKTKSIFDTIVIQMDRNKPFQYLYTIINTTGYLNIGNILLEVKNMKDNQAFVYLKPSDNNSSKTVGNCEAGIKTLLIFSDNAITLGFKFGFVTTIYTNTKDSAHVFDKLHKALKELQKKYYNSMDSKSAILAFNDNYPYCQVIKYLDFAYFYGFTNLQLAKLDSSADSTNNQNNCMLYNRSRESINKIVISHLVELKSLYNENLKADTSSGQITIKFNIAQNGKVISAEVKESALKNQAFQKKVLEKIKKWNFGEIDKPGDITEVIYPFAFGK